MAGPHTARLHGLAAACSMSVHRTDTRLAIIRTGPGHPRRLTRTITDGDWEAAARDLANELERNATPDKH